MAENKNEVAPVKKNVDTKDRVTDLSLGIWGTSDNFAMAQKMAMALSTSTIVPRDFQNNVGNCIIALEQANRLHMSPMMVMQNLYLIQGKPSWSSSFLIACINAGGKYDGDLDFDEVPDKDGKPFSCTAYAYKNGRRVNGLTVTMDIARAEGWTSKNGSKWKTMPQLMLRYRAASFFAKLNCPEITLGISSREEVVEGEYTEEQLMETKLNNEVVVEEITKDVADKQANVPDFMKE